MQKDHGSRDVACWSPALVLEAATRDGMVAALACSVVVDITRDEVRLQARDRSRKPDAPA
jgi:hypothetical protein